MGSAPFRATPRQTIKTFYAIPAEILDDEDLMQAWSRRALAAAEDALKARQRPSKRASTKRRRRT